jgi:hypothetical protein
VKPIASIDPGLNGAYAILSLTGELIELGRLETIPLGRGKRRLINATHLHDKLVKNATAHTVIENVATRPGQGIASSGNFMMATGTIFGVAAPLGSVSWVAPQTWKRHHGLLGQEKEASRQLAISKFGPELFKLKKDTDKAEAVLIGVWYVETAGKALLKVLNSAPPVIVPTA